MRQNWIVVPVVFGHCTAVPVGTPEGLGEELLELAGEGELPGRPGTGKVGAVAGGATGSAEAIPAPARRLRPSTRRAAAIGRRLMATLGSRCRDGLRAFP